MKPSQLITARVGLRKHAARFPRFNDKEQWKTILPSKHGEALFSQVARLN
jgi:hypothetical protein